MQFNHEIFSIIQNFLALVKNQFATTVTRIRTENALERLKSNATSFSYSSGIFHVTFCVYTYHKMEL